MRIFILFLLLPVVSWGQGKRLYVRGAGATSYLSSNWNKYDENYHPNYAFDDNPATAWVEGADGFGQGDSLNWQVSRIATASKLILRIRNGYQKSEALFKANSAPKDIVVSVRTNEYELLNFEKTLTQTMGWQELVLPLQENQGLAEIKLEIKSVYEGTKYKDTCISDIQTLVESKVPYNAEAELEKFNGLKKWIKNRVKQAQYFSDLPQTYPFAATRFEKSKDAEASCEQSKCDGNVAVFLRDGEKKFPIVKTEDLKEIRDIFSKADELHKDAKWWRPAFSRVSDSFSYPDFVSGWNFSFDRNNALAPYFRGSEVSFFEVSKAVSKKVGTNFGFEVASNAKVRFFPKTRKPEMVLLYGAALWNERGVTQIDSNQILTYNSDGQLTSILVIETQSYPKWDTQRIADGQSFVRTPSLGDEFSYYRMKHTAGKIDRVSLHNLLRKYDPGFYISEFKATTLGPDKK